MKRTKNTATLIIAIVCAFFASMTASAKTAKSPKLSKNKATIETGKSLTLSVKNRGKNTVKWSSSNKKVATVSKSGKVTAKKAGSAKITAKVGKKKLSCKITVKPAKIVAAASKNIAMTSVATQTTVDTQDNCSNIQSSTKTECQDCQNLHVDISGFQNPGRYDMRQNPCADGHAIMICMNCGEHYHTDTLAGNLAVIDHQKAHVWANNWHYGWTVVLVD